MLSSIKLSSKNYVKPGKTQAIAKDLGTSVSGESRKASEKSFVDTSSSFQGSVRIHHGFGANTCANVVEPRGFMGASNLPTASGAFEERKSLNKHSTVPAATSNNSYPQAMHDVSCNFAVQSGNAYDEDIDDNILEVIYLVCI